MLNNLWVSSRLIRSERRIGRDCVVRNVTGSSPYCNRYFISVPFSSQWLNSLYFSVYSFSAQFVLLIKPYNKIILLQNKCISSNTKFPHLFKDNTFLDKTNPSNVQLYTPMYRHRKLRIVLKCKTRRCQISVLCLNNDKRVN